MLLHRGGVLRVIAKHTAGHEVDGDENKVRQQPGGWGPPTGAFHQRCTKWNSVNIFMPHCHVLCRCLPARRMLPRMRKCTSC